MKNKPVLFLSPVKHSNKNRAVCKYMWAYGTAFKVIQGKEEDIGELVSIRSIDKFREKYSRVYIQYDMGIVDV